MRRNLLKGTGKVFRFTLSDTVISKGWLISTIVMVALLLYGIPLVFTLITKIQSSDDSENGTISQVYVCDETEGTVDYSFLQERGYSETEWKPYESVDAANAAVVNANETLILEIAKDEESNFALTAYLPEETTLTDSDARALCSFVVDNFDDIRMQKAEISEEAAELLATNIRPSTKILTEDGTEVADKSDMQEAMNFMVPFIMALLVYTMVAVYGQALGNSILLEKTNKLMDTMLISVHPFAIIFGKLLAIVTSAAIQFCLWIFALINGIMGAIVLNMNADMMQTGGETTAAMTEETSSVAMKLLMGEQYLTMSGITWTLLIVLLGFLLYLSLAAISGSLASKQEDLAKTNYIFIFTLVISFMIVAFSSMDEIVASAESSVTWMDLVPFTAILSLPGKLLLGDVSNLTAGISVLLLIAACVVCVYIAAMLYKLMVLYRGNPPTPKALMTMLKNKDSFGMEKGESSHDKSGTE